MKFILSSLVAIAMTAPAPAQRPGPFSRNPDFDGSVSEGSFDIHVRVDGEVFLYVQGSEVTHLIVSGAPLGLERTAYSQPIPEAVYGRFELEKLDGRGDVELFETPSRANGYTAVIRVNDSRGGPDRYHLRLHWTWDPNNPDRAPRDGDGGFVDFPRDDWFDLGSSSGGFSFRGRVDHVTAVTVRGNRVWFEDFGGQRLRNERYDLSGPLPASPVEVELRNVRGRGRVELVERPWEGNGYSAVIRVEDLSGGAADYSFDLEWRRR